MNFQLATKLAVLMLFSSAAVAKDVNDSQSAERGTEAALSTVVIKGIEEQGLTMGQQWSDDVIVCRREKLTGSRFARKVCHSRGEWQAMQSNGYESLEFLQRRHLQ